MEWLYSHYYYKGGAVMEAQNKKNYINLGYGNAYFHLTKKNAVKQLKVFAQDEKGNVYVVILDFNKVKDLIIKDNASI